VRFTSPPYQVGNDLIMLERNVWSYNKKAGRIMKIPSNQAFGDTGFAYGDVVRLNMTDNYTAEILSQTDDSWLLNLQSKERNAPYYRIEFQVKKGSYMPVKATCIARNDMIIKTMEFTEVKAVNGKGKPTRIVVKSPYDPGEVSIMIMENEELKEYPDRIFNKRNLAMGQEERY
jgi:outer membrane lipoprotein-sorting protein